MYNPNTKELSENIKEDWREHFETTYYHYHFYIDNLVNAIWHIVKRLTYNANSSIDDRRIDRNKSEYKDRNDK